MKKQLSARLLSALAALVLCLAACAPAFAEPDYTMGTKFFRQIWASCGLMATVEVELSANTAAKGEALVSKQPFVIDLDYIYLKPDEKEQIKPSHRLNAVLKNGEAAAADLHMQLMEGVVSLHTPLLGEKWWAVPLASLLEEPAQGQENTLAAQLTPGLQGVLKSSSMPAFLQMVLPQLLRMQYQSKAVDELMGHIYLRTDLWIEGYREDAVLSRMTDGSPVVTVNYAVSPANVKAQAKQIVLDVLSDEAALADLRTAMDEDMAALLLNPAYQPYYFAAIDQLPLTGDLTLSRTLDMKGETVALNLSLPFYDAQEGAVALMYDRARGEGDLPDTNTLTVQGEKQGMSLSYLTYRSLTDVTVYQGTLSVTGEGENLPDMAFTLSSQETQTKEDGDQNVHTVNWQLQLEPDPNGNTPEAFLPVQLQLEAVFTSRTPQTAATYVEAVLTVSGDERPQIITVRLDGEIHPHWEPEAIPGEQADLLSLAGADLEDLLATVLTESGALMELLAENTTAQACGAAPAEDGATAPAEDGATAPVEDDTAAPAEDEGTEPSEDEAAAPAEGEATEPSEDEAAAPAEDEATEPSEDEAAAPAEGEATTPVEDDAAAPAEDEATEPSEDEAAAPAEDEATTPVEDEAAAPAEGEATEPSEDEAAAPAEGEATEPSEDEAAAPAEDEGTTPVEDEAAAPAEGEATAPVEDDTAAPAEDAAANAVQE